LWQQETSLLCDGRKNNGAMTASESLVDTFWKSFLEGDGVMMARDSKISDDLVKVSNKNVF
jgi:hypothetical protein